MAVTADKVVVELELRDGQYLSRLRESESAFKKSMDATERSAEMAARDISRAMGRVPDDLRRQYRQLGEDIGQSFLGMSRAAGLAFGAITAYSLKLASDAQEIESAFGVAFGSATADVKAFSEQLADTAGRDSVVLRESMTRLQLVLTGTGVAATDAARMVEQLTAIGVDAGSLFNTSDAEALQKIISGLTGEAEPLKAFGVVLTEAAVKAELLRLGFKGNAEGASEAAKSIARANLIIKGLAVAQGDAARTSDSAANTTKRMTAEFNKAARDIGQQLLPIMTRLFGAATDVLKAFNDLPGGVQVAGLGFLGLIAAGGPIAGLLANLARVIKIAKETRAALIAASLGGGVGGAAARAAGGGALAAGGAAVIAGAGVLSVGGSTDRRPLQGQERVNAQLREEARVRGEIARLTREGNAAEAARQQAYLSRVSARRVAETREAATARAAESAATTDAEADATVVGGFALPPSLMTGTGGSGSGRGSGGSAAIDNTDARERLSIEEDINRARAAGDDAAINAAEERRELAELTARYESAGYDDAEARALEQLSLLNQVEERAEAKARNQRIAEEAAESEARATELVRDILGEILDAQEENATTEEESLAIRRQILEVRQAERREAIEAALLSKDITEEQRKQLELALANLDAIEKGERDRIGSKGVRVARDVLGAIGQAAGSDAAADSNRADAIDYINQQEADDVTSHQDAMNARAQIDAAYWENRLTGEKSMLAGIASLQNSSIKELAALGKAAALAQAAIQGYLAIQVAVASAPFPFNVPAIAFATAQTAVNLAGIAGLKDGGIVTGTGGPREDNQLRRLSVGEFVNNAESVRKNRPYLEAANNGADLSRLLPGLRDGGYVSRVNVNAPRLSDRAGRSVSNVFSPSIDARGADLAAVSRLEQIVDEQSRTFADRVNGVRDRRNTYRLGGRK